MAGISKCANGTSCELKDNCMRYLAKDSVYQSYMNSPNPGLGCEFYFPYSRDYMKPFNPGYCKSENTDK